MYALPQTHSWIIKVTQRSSWDQNRLYHPLALFRRGKLHFLRMGGKLLLWKGICLTVQKLHSSAWSYRETIRPQDQTNPHPGVLSPLRYQFHLPPEIRTELRGVEMSQCTWSCTKSQAEVQKGRRLKPGHMTCWRRSPGFLIPTQHPSLCLPLLSLPLEGQ